MACPRDDLMKSFALYLSAGHDGEKEERNCAVRTG